MNDESLFEIVIEVVWFFESCDPGAIDDDIAVRMLETVAFHLQNASPASRREFIAYAARRAANAKTERERAFLAALPEALGISER